MIPCGCVFIPSTEMEMDLIAARVVAAKTSDEDVLERFKFLFLEFTVAV